MNQQTDTNQPSSELTELLGSQLDPDAAELLRDLDDEEGDDGPEAGIDAPRLSNPSLASVMTVSSSPIMDSAGDSSPIPKRPFLVSGVEIGVGYRSEPLPKVELKQESVTEQTPADESDDNSAFLTGATLPQLQPVPLTPSASAQPKAIQEEENPEEDAQELKSEELSPEDKAGASNQEPDAGADNNESTPENQVEAKSGTEQSSKVTHSLNQSKPPARKPNAPPPVPPTAPVRVLKENEIAITTEALTAMCAGGLLDEAPDLEQHNFIDNSWYTQIFNDDYLRTTPSDIDRQTKREAKFIIDRLGMQEGARMLDLCCGYGRHTLALSHLGFDMVGFDLSMIMLRKALSDAQKSGLSIKFVHGDMQKLSFKSIFDAIYNVQTSFGYFNDQKNFKVLQGILHALKPGGRFFIETINRDFFIDQLPHRIFWKGVDCTIFEEIDLDYYLGVLKVKRSFVFSDSARAPWEQFINIRLYTASEMRALLQRAGFEIIELSGDYSLPGAFFGAQSPRVIFVAERPIP